MKSRANSPRPFCISQELFVSASRFSNCSGQRLLNRQQTIKNRQQTKNGKTIVMNTQKLNQQKSKAIVLVHGGFVDGSGWAGVYSILKKKGYDVSIVQNPTKSLADDVAVTKAAIDNLDSKVVLVGHSYGGVVITEAGTHPKGSDLVYISAFAPAKGESVT